MRVLCIKYTCALCKHFKYAVLKRYSSNETVRVRFAPSPTGLLHLGGLRTALYNYLFAKSQNGVSILRIEDTDQGRVVESATENLIEDLNWCGIKFDEGPYYQSDRIDIYKKYANQLLEEEKAYNCFCSKMRLELLRKEALKAGEVPKYDNCCRHLTKEEVNDKLKSGLVPCIRFKLTGFPGPILDLIHNSIVCDTAASEGDPIILKADGFPTYHFANIVDDHLMKITHVLRGSEWQISTPKHILLYKAFNWNPPIYGHIPLLLNADGTKLSKRQNNIHIQGLRKKGYLPNAVLNFVVRFGGGFRIEQKEKDAQIFSMEELLEKFDLTKIKAYSSKITLSKLDDYNNMEIKRLLNTDEGQEKLVNDLQRIITAHYETKSTDQTKKPIINPKHLKFILHKLQNRIYRLEDLVTKNYICLWFWDNNVLLTEKKQIEMLEKFLLKIDSMEWEVESVKNFIRQFAKENEFNFVEFMKLLRLTLIEVKEGLSVGEILDLLGKEIVQSRLARVIEKSKNSILLNGKK